jgi:hypothetical protein
MPPPSAPEAGSDRCCQSRGRIVGVLHLLWRGLDRFRNGRMCTLVPRLGACELASLKNNLLLSAEIGFVSLWCFMQAINC